MLYWILLLVLALVLLHAKNRKGILSRLKFSLNLLKRRIKDFHYLVKIKLKLDFLIAHKVYTRIIGLVIQAAKLARSVGIQNLLQPGLVKEMIIADILGHRLITSKRDADAWDPKSPSIVYEYLSCK